MTKYLLTAGFILNSLLNYTSDTDSPVLNSSVFTMLSAGPCVKLVDRRMTPQCYHEPYALRAKSK